jgi:hypothetical protein
MLTDLLHRLEWGLFMWFILLGVIVHNLKKNPAAAGTIAKIVFGFFKK